MSANLTVDKEQIELSLHMLTSQAALQTQLATILGNDTPYPLHKHVKEIVPICRHLRETNPSDN